MKKVLLVNDDGINSPGLHALAELFSELGWEITMVAPAHNQSGKSFAITFNSPIKVTSVAPRSLRKIANLKCYKVFGTPLDCVNLGLKQLMPTMPDLLVSGINAGANVSFNILYSGTVSNAIESSRFKIPSIAISVANFFPANEHYIQAKKTLKEVLKTYPFDYSKVYNINIPDQFDAPKVVNTCVLEGSPNGFYKEISPGKYQLMEDEHDLSLVKKGHLPTDVETLRNGNVSLSILHVERPLPVMLQVEIPVEDN